MSAFIPKRILILSHEFLPFHGGIATYCAEIAEAAVRRGHRVTVVAPDYHRDNAADDAKKPYKVIRFKGSFYGTRQMPRVILEVLKINPKDYDVVHAAEWSFVVALHLVNGFKKIPFIATMHGTDIFGFSTSRVTRVLRATDTLKRADLITANSAFTANLAAQYHPYVTQDKLRVTLLGVSPWWFEPAKDAAGVKQRYGIAADKKVLLTVARLEPRKGHRSVLKALTLLSHAEKEQLAYVVIGKADNDEYMDELKTLADRSGVQVVFTGGIDQEDVRSFYKAAWLFCMLGEPNPKKVEGFGLAYLEAAAQGLASIATPLGGVPEVVLDGKTGLLLKEAEPAIVTKTISGFLNDPESLAAYGQNALSWAKDFTWDRCAEQTYG